VKHTNLLHTIALYTQVSHIQGETSTNPYSSLSRAPDSKQLLWRNLSRYCKTTREGGREWYQSIGLIFVYISANFLLFFKEPDPLNSQKCSWVAKQLCMYHDWIKWPTLQKNTIAGGSLFGFFSIPRIRMNVWMFMLKEK
jgi:hypothetical protein